MLIANTFPKYARAHILEYALISFVWCDGVSFFANADVLAGCFFSPFHHN